MGTDDNVSATLSADVRPPPGDGWRVKLPTAVRRSCIIIASALCAIVAGVAILVGLLFAGVVSLSDIGLGTMQLPAFGRPQDSSELENDSLGCKSAVSSNWCRSLIFGSIRHFALTREQLKTAYADHQWNVAPSADETRLEVSSPSNSVCISYENISARPTPLPSYFPQKWRDYAVLINVWILPCPPPPH